jgi:serine/threonine protein phosphatase PrpC
LRLEVGHCSEQGVRPSMEDETIIESEINLEPQSHLISNPISFFVVLDGHGGVQMLVIQEHYYVTNNNSSNNNNIKNKIQFQILHKTMHHRMHQMIHLLHHLYLFLCCIQSLHLHWTTRLIDLMKLR